MSKKDHRPKSRGMGIDLGDLSKTPLDVKRPGMIGLSDKVPEDDRPARDRPIRVLQIAFTMNARGAETSLVHALRQADSKRVQMDFMTVEGKQGFHDEEIKALGGTLIPSPGPQRKWALLKALRKTLKENGPYDIVHAHPYTLSGLILKESAKAGVPVRIAHARTDHRRLESQAGPIRRAYVWLMKKMITRYATAGLAISEAAAESLFGPGWYTDSRWRLLPSGIDFNAFEKDPSPGLKEDLEIPAEAEVIGHVGALVPEKNHRFVLDVFAALAKENDNLRLVLVGEGPEREALETYAKTLHVDNHVLFLGQRGDVPDLLQMMDVFLFPSLYEGMGRVALEAQAAGLPCILPKNRVPEDVDVIEDIVFWLDLEAGTEKWAEKTKYCLGKTKMNKNEALKKLQDSQFDIQNNAKILFDFYEEQMQW